MQSILFQLIVIAVAVVNSNTGTGPTDGTVYTYNKEINSHHKSDSDNYLILVDMHVHKANNFIVFRCISKDETLCRYTIIFNVHIIMTACKLTCTLGVRYYC